MSATEVSEQILEDIRQSIASKEYGSVEIYIESGQVVQITERTIRKTNRKPEKQISTYNSNIKRSP